MRQRIYSPENMAVLCFPELLSVALSYIYPALLGDSGCSHLLSVFLACAQLYWPFVDT